MKEVPALNFAALSARKIRLAWQLPTFSGTKSYQNLLVEVYGMQDNAYPDWPNTNMDTVIQNEPTSFIRNGLYLYSSGNIDSRTSRGYYWEPDVTSATNAKLLDFASTYLRPRDGSNKGYGFLLRCLVRWSLGRLTGNSLPTVVLKAIRTYWLGCME